MKGLIVSNGNISNYSLLKSLINESDFVICADGGINHLSHIGIVPDIVIGDLDSVNEIGLRFISENNINVKRFSAIKDETDTYIALEYLCEKGFKEIVLTGVTGTRLDHTMANIFLLNTLKERGIKGSIVDDYNTIHLIQDYIEIENKKDYYISLIPIENQGINISLSGFYYNLDNENINFGSTRGISNRVMDKVGKVKINKGKALLFISKD